MKECQFLYLDCNYKEAAEWVRILQQVDIVVCYPNIGTQLEKLFGLEVGATHLCTQHINVDEL